MFQRHVSEIPVEIWRVPHPAVILATRSSSVPADVSQLSQGVSSQEIVMDRWRHHRPQNSSDHEMLFHDFLQHS
jgi:hypothetical protein